MVMGPAGPDSRNDCEFKASSKLQTDKSVSNRELAHVVGGYP
jgi:hypothetical protein